MIESQFFILVLQKKIAMGIKALKEKTSAYRNQLLNHDLYKLVEGPKDLQVFMEHHVFAVWDFMSLLKALQQQLTCTQTPWVPVGNPQHRYLINEIVLAEETDLNIHGNRQSHYEMYIDAMRKANANTAPVETLIELIQKGKSFDEAKQELNLPSSVEAFLNFTFKVVDYGKPHEIAAAFTFGREELIPDMFSSIINEIQQNFPEQDLSLFKYYFDRHIELDEDEHGPMALELIEELCGNDAEKWEEAEKISVEALQLRAGLWDGIAKEVMRYKAIA